VVVADESSAKPGPFDIQTIRQLVALMSRHDLNEIDLRQGESRIRLRRGPYQKAAPLPTPPALHLPAPVPTLAPPPVVPTEPPKPAKNLNPIKSPTPGTFYASPAPGADAFVRVGSRVTPTTVVCVIEAMKIFNEITADCSGVITEILVENQQAVEWGQVLFQVDPSG
jgi:acetyl-CoA carboxylase biotin carboxyl carrier protein